MIGVALKGLAGRKLRAILTAFAIVLGVTMVSGTYVLTDTINKAFDSIFQETYANTDAVVSGKTADINVQGDTADKPSIPASLLEKVRALPDTAAATGSVIDDSHTKILKKNGKAINTQGAPSFGFGIDPAQAQFNPLKLVEGRWPASSNEVVTDSQSADEQGYKVGDTIKVATLKPVQSFKLVGLAHYGEVASIGSATFAVFTIPKAQQLLDRVGQYDAISVAAKDGVTPEKLVQEIRTILPSDAIVRTGAQQASEDKKDVEFTKFIRYLLLAFAGVALFVGAFVIFNTLSITVAQRTREFATLRTIGASRKQVLSSVIIEASVIGLIASLTGLFLGLGLAAFLNWLFKQFNLDLPTQGIVFAPRTIIVSLAIGMIVTLVAGLLPARKATRVPPIAAVREGFVLPTGRMARFVPYIALVVIALAVAVLSYSLFKHHIGTAQRLIAMAVGVLALFIGVAMVSSRTVRPLAVATGPVAKWAVVVFSTIFYPITLSYWLLRSAAFAQHASAGRRLRHAASGVAILLALVVLVSLIAKALGFIAVGVAAILVATVLFIWIRSAVSSFEPEWPVEFPNVRPERTMSALARENSRRNPGRTASTAAALMIGIALVTFVAVLANGMKSSNSDAIKQQVKAEYVLTAQDGFSPFVPDAGEAVGRSSDSEFTTSVRSGLGKAEGESGYVTGIQQGAIAQAYTFKWKQGSDAVLNNMGRNGAIIAKDFADQKKLNVGDKLSLLVPSGQRADLVVKGIYEPPPFFPILGEVSITQSLFDSLYERPQNSFVFVDVRGEPSDATTKSLETAVKDFPDAKVQTRTGWIEQQNKDFNSFLNMLYVLLALAVVVSIFGMVNTLVLSVFERTRELGMLRAVGMTQRQARRMVRNESIITALIGAALGLPLGIFLALLMTKALSQFNVQIKIPIGQLAIFAVVAIVVGMFAAIFPARRAARLNVLRALQYE
ncbi:MAG TPA: FtsX-like permease family protein [Gaiellaceae bacterium]|nr:FtsX-like permease family protein [Gaiellaceae bacterium]